MSTITTSETPVVAVARPEGRTTLITAAWRELAEHGASGLSLRAVARRAGVSHAAPKYHFGDRAGLLTALAVEGFRALEERFVEAADDEEADPLAVLGRVFLDFSLTYPEMFEVMYGTEPLHADDPDLMAGRRLVFTRLSNAVTRTGPDQPAGYGEPVPIATLMTWSVIHGLVSLTRDGSLQRVAGTGTAEQTAELAHALAETFTRRLRSIEW